jgi:hypothetical protein
MLERFPKGFRREKGGEYRELYADPLLTVFVWYRSEGPRRRVVAFQIVWPEERMIAWSEASGLSHSELSQDDDAGLSGAKSSIATRDLGPIRREDVEDFLARARNMDRATVERILSAISSIP